MMTAKDIVAAIGREKVAKSLGVVDTAVCNAIAANAFPASWYFCIRTLGKDSGVDVPEGLFNWKSTPVSDDTHTAA